MGTADMDHHHSASEDVAALSHTFSDSDSKILSRAYYLDSAKVLAPDMLGKIMCRRIGSNVLRHRIIETECYFGEEDTACHASHGRTKRSEYLYHPGGIAYVHRCHMYNLLTLVTGPEEHPEGVLIRGIAGHEGPGRVGRDMDITSAIRGNQLGCASGLWLEDDGCKPGYAAFKRVNIQYADQKDREVLWRFKVMDGITDDHLRERMRLYGYRGNIGFYDRKASDSRFDFNTGQSDVLWIF